MKKSPTFLLVDLHKHVTLIRNFSDRRRQRQTDNTDTLYPTS